MVAALELYLDRDASRRVRTLWAALEADGVPTVATLMDGLHRPHVSLAVADQLEPQAVAEALDGFSAVPSVRLAFHFAGQFLGRVLWLGPAPSLPLLEHQAEVDRRLAEAGIAVWNHYRPGQWVPHCTISMRVPNPVMGAAIRRCLEYVPIEASLVGAAVADHARGIRHEIA